MKKMLCIVVTLFFVVGCSNDPGDHGSNSIITLKDVNSDAVILSCPSFNRKPMGSHGRECYLVDDEL